MRLGKFLEINGLRFLHTLEPASGVLLLSSHSSPSLFIIHFGHSACPSSYFKCYFALTFAIFYTVYFLSCFLFLTFYILKWWSTSLQRETPHKNVGKAYFAMTIFSNLNFSMYDTTLQWIFALLALKRRCRFSSLIRADSKLMIFSC